MCASTALVGYRVLLYVLDSHVVQSSAAVPYWPGRVLDRCTWTRSTTVPRALTNGPGVLTVISRMCSVASFCCPVHLQYCSSRIRAYRYVDVLNVYFFSKANLASYSYCRCTLTTTHGPIIELF